MAADPGANIKDDPTNPATKPEDVGHMTTSFEKEHVYCNTLVIRPEYRISLRLGSIEELFPWPIDSIPGRLARMQVLGLCYWPLKHRVAAGSATDPDTGLKRKPDVPNAKMAENQEAHKVAWNYFKRKFCGVEEAKLNTPEGETKGEAELKKRLENWVVQQMSAAPGGGQGGQLPTNAPEDDKGKPKPDEAKGHFAKIRLPGGYVFLSEGQSSDYSADQTISGMEMYNPRYDHETNCHKQNPVLGKVPIIATVEKRDPGKDEWKPAKGATVHFQLQKPYDLPAHDAARKAHQQLNRPPLVGSAYSVTHPDPPSYSSGAGPKYFDELWQKHQVDNNNPQVNNCHIDCGGKRLTGDQADGSDVAANGRSAIDQQLKSLFWVGDFPGFTKPHENPPAGYHNFKANPNGSSGAALTKRQLPKEPSRPATEVVSDASHPHCVKAKTNDDGEAGLIFMPSRCGGDHYRLRAYLADDGEGFKSTGKEFNAVRADTGTFVVWRNIRLSRWLKLKLAQNDLTVGDTSGLMAHDYHRTRDPGYAETPATISLNNRDIWGRAFGVYNWDNPTTYAGLPALDLDTLSNGAIGGAYDGLRPAVARGFCELDTDPDYAADITVAEWKKAADAGYENAALHQRLSTSARVKQIRLDALFFRGNTNGNANNWKNIDPAHIGQAPLLVCCPARAPRSFDAECWTRANIAPQAKLHNTANPATEKQWREAADGILEAFKAGFARAVAGNGYLPGMTCIQGMSFSNTEVFGNGLTGVKGQATGYHAVYVMMGDAIYRDRIGDAWEGRKLFGPASGFVMPAAHNNQKEHLRGYMVTVVHEMGHCWFKVHAPGLRAGSPASGTLGPRHDSWGHLTSDALTVAPQTPEGLPLGQPRFGTCLMSYRNCENMFCARCLFELRGWNILAQKMAAKKADPIPPKAVIGAPAGPVAPAAVPGQPPDLKAVVGDKQVHLTWSAATDAASYTIRRGTAAGGPYGTVVAANVAALSCTDNGVVNGTQYYYVVIATNSVGDGPASNEAAAKPGVLAAPTNLTLTYLPGPPPQARLNWNASPGATGYEVFYNWESRKYANVAPIASAGPPQLINLGEGQKLFFAVVAVSGSERSDYSNEVSVVVKPPKPTGLTLAAGVKSAKLTWQQAEGADNYKIKRGTTAGGPYPNVFTVGQHTTTYNDSGLADGQTYYYVVTASNSGGESDPSAEVTVTFKPARPASLTATKGDTRATLSWPAVTGAKRYKVKVATTSGGPYALSETVTAPTVSRIVTGLTNGTTYYFVVSAENDAGEGPDSAQASVTPGP